MAGVTLAGARVSRELTQQELADKMGVSRSTVLCWERGKREMKEVYLNLFCQITGFKKADIILPKRTTKSGDVA